MEESFSRCVSSRHQWGRVPPPAKLMDATGGSACRRSPVLIEGALSISVEEAQMKCHGRFSLWHFPAQVRVIGGETRLQPDGTEARLRDTVILSVPCALLSCPRPKP